MIRSDNELVKNISLLLLGNIFEKERERIRVEYSPINVVGLSAVCYYHCNPYIIILNINELYYKKVQISLSTCTYVYVY